MSEYSAKIRAKGLEATGVTEEIARRLHDNLGTYTMAIVELRAEKRFDDADGSHGVELVLTQVEPSSDTRLDDHLRNLTKALHTNRVLNSQDEQLQLDTTDDISPKVGDVIAAGQDLEAGSDKAEDDSADVTPDDDEPDERPNPAWEPHTYVDTAYGTCGYPDCGAAAGDKVHTDATVTPIGKSPFVTT